MQIRTLATGTAVRLHMWLKTPAVEHNHGSRTIDSLNLI